MPFVFAAMVRCGPPPSCHCCCGGCCRPPPDCAREDPLAESAAVFGGGACADSLSLASGDGECEAATLRHFLANNKASNEPGTGLGTSSGSGAAVAEGARGGEEQPQGEVLACPPSPSPSCAPLTGETGENERARLPLAGRDPADSSVLAFFVNRALLKDGAARTRLTSGGGGSEARAAPKNASVSPGASPAADVRAAAAAAAANHVPSSACASSRSSSETSSATSNRCSPKAPVSAANAAAALLASPATVASCCAGVERVRVGAASRAVAVSLSKPPLFRAVSHKDKSRSTSATGSSCVPAAPAAPAGPLEAAPAAPVAAAAAAAAEARRATWRELPLPRMQTSSSASTASTCWTDAVSVSSCADASPVRRFQEWSMSFSCSSNTRARAFVVLACSPMVAFKASRLRSCSRADSLRRRKALPNSSALGAGVAELRRRIFRRLSACCSSVPWASMASSTWSIHTASASRPTTAAAAATTVPRSAPTSPRSRHSSAVAQAGRRRAAVGKLKRPAEAPPARPMGTTTAPAFQAAWASWATLGPPPMTT
mmetsp:Transcript_61285/g.198254  ORF Transcript_61285/g.198254 Transcript_61285/m.198254 type:complete len:546 (+) Transcript_61285:741-2378(+)